MRWTQSILVIVALLSTPLVLLARTDSVDQNQCTRMCCLVQRGAPSAKAKPRRCVCGVPAKKLQCAIRSTLSTPDYGLNAPIAPTAPFDLVSLSAPLAERRGILQRAAQIPSGFSALPFQPPRG